jgi:hypothetical protein
VNRTFGLVSALGLSRRLGLVLGLMVTAGASAAHAFDAQVAQNSRVNDTARAGDARLDVRPDATPGPPPQPVPEPSPSPPLPQAEEPASAVEQTTVPAFVQGQDSQPFMAQPDARKRKRTKAQARLSGLAVMAARIATQAKLRGAGTFEAPRGMVDTTERRILLRRPEPSPAPAKPETAPPPASIGVLDETIVKEIGQRKTMFRMCYESARRRGVTVTRADVKWILSPDGSVRDVVVEVAQDDLLARCIRVIASRPFPTAVPQEIPVTIPLLFVSER